MYLERRRNPRLKTRVPASLRPFAAWCIGQSTQCEATIHNLGVGGAQVVTDALLPADTRLFLQFSLQGSSQTDRAYGRVVEILPFGNRYLLSVAFTEVSEKLIQAIEDLILTSTPGRGQKLLL